MLDRFVSVFRDYQTYRLESSLGASFLSKLPACVPPESPPSSWDFSTLFSLFTQLPNLFEADFSRFQHSKSLLFEVKTLRNRRAHDQQMQAREVLRGADTLLLFLEDINVMQDQQLLGEFDQYRLSALELLY